MFIAALVSSVSVFVLLVTTSRSEMASASKDQLESLALISKTRVEKYFKNSKAFTESLGQDRLIEGMFLAYEGAFFSAGLDIGQDTEIPASVYSKLNATYGPRVSQILENFELENFFLANFDSQIIFSAKTSPFLGKNILEGSLKGTSLDKCFQENIDKVNRKADFYDFSYFQDTKEAKAFLCVKAFAEFDHLSEGIKKGDTMGVVIAQLSLKTINSILSQRVGMGETGQSFLVGEDGLLRSNFFLNSEKYNIHNSHKMDLRIDTEGVGKALKSENGFTYTVGALGDEVAQVYLPIEVYGKNWALISEKTSSEIFAPIQEMIIKASVSLLIVIALVLFLAKLMATAFSKPLIQLGKSLGDLADTLNSSSTRLNSSAEKLSSASAQQAAIVEETKAGLDRIMVGSEKNLERAAKSQEISTHVSGETSTAHTQMQNLVTAMRSIRGSFDEIDNMVEVIREVGNKTEVMNSIAYKTQILSFNASIEAARAGSAGRGFAVVAQEVGQLAKMSSKAATEIEDAISKTVEKVEELTEGSKTSVGRGEELVGEISELLDRVVVSTDEVKESSASIYESSTEQTSSVSEINTAVEQILTAVNASQTQAIETRGQSEELEAQSKNLNDIAKRLINVIYGHKQSGEVHLEEKDDSDDSLKRNFKLKSIKEKVFKLRA